MDYLQFNEDYELDIAFVLGVFIASLLHIYLAGTQCSSTFAVAFAMRNSKRLFGI
ncbi:MAG: hypothetical protein R6W92_08730 [Desulfocurvibacter africanus]